jgi:hypothetical protein
MTAEQQARLAVELQYFSMHKSEWLASRASQYVVIKENQPLGFYPTFESAYRAGAVSYGLETDFLVKQILEYEPVFVVL